MPKNTVCHVEIMGRDSKQLSEFYKELFGWKLNYDMGDEYVMFQPESGPGGGFMKAEGPVAGSCGVTVYIEVDDVAAYLQKAVELGGKAMVPRTEIPNVGWFGQFIDLDGNKIGLFSS